MRRRLGLDGPTRLDALRAIVAVDLGDRCRWIVLDDGDDCGPYETACGHVCELAPDLGMRFCPYCGRRLDTVRAQRGQ